MTFVIPSFYLLPPNPCTQLCLCPGHNDQEPPNSQGRNLSTISNFGLLSSHCGAAWFEKRVKSLCRSFIIWRGKHWPCSCGAPGTKQRSWAQTWHPGPAVCRVTVAPPGDTAPPVPLNQVNSPWAKFSCFHHKVLLQLRAVQLMLHVSHGPLQTLDKLRNCWQK